jgi:TetR/AcrR family transcriptional regulator, cholesterol catabolism regulator
MKENIITKSGEMFLKGGFKSVTMDDIASEMGISKKTIYQHFETKPKLIEAVTQHLHETISHGIDKICSVGKDPIDELFDIKEFVMNYLKNESTAQIYQLQKYYPKIHKTLMTKYFEKMADCIIRNLRNGITKGLFRENLNIEIIGRFYFSGMTSLRDAELFTPDKFSYSDVQHAYLEYHLRGICTPKGIQILEKLLNNTNPN